MSLLIASFLAKPLLSNLIETGLASTLIKKLNFLPLLEMSVTIAGH